MLTISPVQTNLQRADPAIRIIELELAQPLPALSAFDEQKGRSYRQVRCLVRLHTRCLGQVDFTLDKDEFSAEIVASTIWQVLGEQINAHLRADGLPEITALSVDGVLSAEKPECLVEREMFLQTAPFVSVIVPTHDRPDRLARCLSALVALQYPDYEIIVVDNAPTTCATADLVQLMSKEKPEVIYLREDHAGVSWARNQGIAHARGTIIAFADDDVVADAHWLTELVRGFSVTEDVVCVTGLVIPLELDTPAQLMFEAYDGFTRGFAQRIFDLREHRHNKPAYPYMIGVCGISASVAVTADFLRRDNGFDLALGTGTPSGGGEDHALFFRAITRGHRLVYAPASLVYHQHRREHAALEKQIYFYGIGLTAYFTKILFDEPWRIFDCFVKFVRSAIFLTRAGALRPDRDYPGELKDLERKGWLRGPWAYIQSRHASGWWRNGLRRAQEVEAGRERAKLWTKMANQES